MLVSSGNGLDWKMMTTPIVKRLPSWQNQNVNGKTLLPPSDRLSNDEVAWERNDKFEFKLLTWQCTVGPYLTCSRGDSVLLAEDAGISKDDCGACVAPSFSGPANAFQNRRVSSAAPVTMLWPSGATAMYSTRA